MLKTKTPKSKQNHAAAKKVAKNRVKKTKHHTIHKTQNNGFTTLPRSAMTAPALNTTTTTLNARKNKQPFVAMANPQQYQALTSFLDQNFKQFRKFTTTTNPTTPLDQPAAPVTQQPKQQQQGQEQPQQAEQSTNAAPIQQAEVTQQQQEEQQQQAAPQTPETTSKTTTENTATSQQPAYSQFKRIIANGSHKFEPTESYFDENGDECLVIYEASPGVVAKTLLERKRALFNTLVSAPGVAALSAYFIPAPYSWVMYTACAIVGLVNLARLYGLSAFVTKITAVWPQTRSEISGKLNSNLQEALTGLTPLPGEENGPYAGGAEPAENEFEQRAKHNEQIRKELGLEEEKEKPTDQAAGDNTTNDKNNDNNDNTADGTEKNNIAAAKAAYEKMKQQQQLEDSDPLKPVYPQPGVDPMGKVFTFKQHEPDPITWKFGWSDTTNLHKGDAPPLFERQNFSEQVRLWSQLPDPDFPEYVYIDRLNNGKNTLYQKVPLSNVASVWSIAAVPPAIPQVTPTQIEQLQGMKHDAQAILFRADNTVTGLFPAFIKHDIAFNQLIFASNINARNEVKDKFAHLKGRLKL